MRFARKWFFNYIGSASYVLDSNEIAIQTLGRAAAADADAYVKIAITEAYVKTVGING